VFGLSETTVRTDAELRLRQHDIEVLAPDEREATAGWPYLRITILGHNDLNMAGEHVSYSFAILVELLQNVVLQRDSTMDAVDAVTWSGGVSALFLPRERPAEFVRQKVRDEVDQFANSFLAANGK